jgi:hypothetical protein
MRLRFIASLWLSRVARPGFLAAAFSIALAACSGPVENSNSASNTNTAKKPVSSGDSSRPVVGEPDRYVLTLVLGGAANAAPTQAPAAPAGGSPSANRSANSPRQPAQAPQGWGASSNEMVLSKAGSDRKWVFHLAGLGDAAYLEKSALKYLVLVSRGLYTEISPAELGFDAPRLLNPVSIVGELIPRWKSEGLGMEAVAGRTAFGFRFLPSDQDAGPQRQGTCAISIDQETQLPTRFQIDSPRSLIEARDLRLTVPLTQFDVPSGLKKMNADQLKPLIQAFAAGVQPYIDALNPRRPAQAPPAPPAASSANKGLNATPPLNRAPGNAVPGSSNKRAPVSNSNRKVIRST